MNIISIFIRIDSTYTERYMGYPIRDDNLEGYTRGDILNKVSNFKGKNFLLIHGTADGERDKTDLSMIY